MFVKHPVHTNGTNKLTYTNHAETRRNMLTSSFISIVPRNRRRPVPTLPTTPPNPTPRPLQIQHSNHVLAPLRNRLQLPQVKQHLLLRLRRSPHAPLYSANARRNPPSRQTTRRRKHLMEHQLGIQAQCQKHQPGFDTRATYQSPRYQRHRHSTGPTTPPND